MRFPELIKEYGIKNLRFFIPIRPMEMGGIIPGFGFTSSHITDTVECKITEDRYQVIDRYKIAFIPADLTQYDKYGHETFYQSDAENLFSDAAKKGLRIFRAYVLTIDGYAPVDVTQG